MFLVYLLVGIISSQYYSPLGEFDPCNDMIVRIVEQHQEVGEIPQINGNISIKKTVGFHKEPTYVGENTRELVQNDVYIIHAPNTEKEFYTEEDAEKKLDNLKEAIDNNLKNNIFYNDRMSVFGIDVFINQQSNVIYLSQDYCSKLMLNNGVPLAFYAAMFTPRTFEQMIENGFLTVVRDKDGHTVADYIDKSNAEHYIKYESYLAYVRGFFEDFVQIIADKVDNGLISSFEDLKQNNKTFEIFKKDLENIVAQHKKYITHRRLVKLLDETNIDRLNIKLANDYDYTTSAKNYIAYLMYDYYKAPLKLKNKILKFFPDVKQVEKGKQKIHNNRWRRNKL